ncbi:amiloride-sensitive sodium channel subunit gamma [Sarcophilus harrisii]|uniref:Epithelial sodium channel subunit gamma n=1 Tax=Sarcophilus harrisii TaxID=9305 RepID=G3W678_SARHA|nr:amiloride-sensitive sodium channel subunit gamma [Sarcophilus harrisii]
MAPGEKIKAKIKKNLTVTGPQAPSIKELMKWYCLNTNTHGCRRIVVSRGRLRRLIWVVFTLTAVGLILWQCALLVLSFYSVSVSIKVHFQKLEFPAVTICNINPYKYSALKELLSGLDQETKNALRNLYGLSNIKSRKRREADPPQSSEGDSHSKFLNILPLVVFEPDDTTKEATDLLTGRKRKVSGTIVHKASDVMHVQETKKTVGFQMCEKNGTSDDCATYTFNSGVNAIREWYKLHYMNIMAQVPLEKKINMSYSAEELLVTCFFDGVSCDARNFTLFHHPMYGNCYTFNGDITKTALNTSMGGSEYGLQVILYIDEEEYNPFLISSTGAKVVIHRRDEYPFIEDIGTEIETAMATSIGMHLTESFKLSEPYSQCTKDGRDVPVESIYNATYSLQICLHSCFQRHMSETCHCAQYSQPAPKNVSYCNYQKHPNWMYCYYKLHQAFVQEKLGCQAICREPCKFKEWSLTTSLAQWPSDISEKWMLDVLTWDKGQKENKRLNKTDLAKLLIFYKDLNQRSIIESPANSIEILLSNFGGQLGLWMSCSVVCVLEIIEVFFVDSLSIITRRCWQKIKKRWAQRNTQQGQSPSGNPEDLAGCDNPTCVLDDDLPTFSTALQLPQAPGAHVPGTPPPKYNTLRIERTFSNQLEDTQDSENV